MVDKRSFEIKKVLSKAFPSEVFKVRIHKYSGGESIRICTTLLKKRIYNDAIWRVNANAGYSDQDREEYSKDQEKLKHNEELEAKIKQLIGNYESVDYDDNGEVLLGGNTYLFLEAIE